MDPEKYKPSDVPDTGRFDRRLTELSDLSKEELVEHILEFEGQTSASDTGAYAKPKATRPFDLELEWQPDEYLKLPHQAAINNPERPLMKIMLISFDLAHNIVGIELYGDLVVGRGSGGSSALDLSDHMATEYGVSRKHVLLQVTEHGLAVMDLESTNGTRLNGKRIFANVVYALNHSDVLALGRLEYQIRIVGVDAQAQHVSQCSN